MPSSEKGKRWRKKHPQKWRAKKKRYYASGDYGKNGGDAWNNEDKAHIIATDRPSDRVLSLALGRTINAVQIKRREALRSLGATIG